ncbi:histone chaperone [Dispira simplex]|nr:histone chaperone [Dispira simplex]
MDQSNSQGVNIKTQETKKDDFIAPTPHNTPIVTAPVQSMSQPKMTETTLNSQLVSDLQGRLGSILGAPEDFVESLPASVQRRLQGLKHLQAEHGKLEAEFHKEIFALEKKYLALYQPLYEKRAKIVVGTEEPTEEEVEAGKQVDPKPEGITAPPKADDDGESPLIGVPEFWLTCMKNHGQIDELITDRDEEVLKHLTDISIAYLDDKHAFRLVFAFAPNPYFSNDTLTKTYYYQANTGIGDLVFDYAVGDTIQWKEGKNVTVAVESRKQRNKSTNETRVVKKTVPADSFFNFFQTLHMPEPNDEDDEEFEEMQHRIEADYEIGEEFKEKIIPHAVDWFTGKALEYEGLDYDDYEDDGEDFYGEDSDGDDDIEDEDDDDEQRQVRN